MRLLAAALLLLTLAACDSSSLDPIDPPAQTRTFDVRYLVEGTYAGTGCTLRYRQADRTVATLDAQSLPWDHTERIVLSDRGDASTFNVLLQSACADPQREGKQTSTLFVDQRLVATRSATGFGESVELTYRLGF
jgi:hypothetical protein